MHISDRMGRRFSLNFLYKKRLFEKYHLNAAVIVSILLKILLSAPDNLNAKILIQMANILLFYVL
jgi:hypothetical protein